MSHLNSRFLEVVVGVVGAAILLSPSTAEAQACCAGGGAYAPARLKLFEEALVGIQLQAIDDLGSIDEDGRYLPLPKGDSAVSLSESVLAGYRINDHAQVGLVIPIDETSRVEPGLSEFGGGLGDITVHARYDFILPANPKGIPGIALVGAITAPSGRPPDEAKTPLAVDATGAGYWQGALGLAVEQIFGRWVLDAGVSVWGVLPRTVEDTTELLGPQISGRLALGYGFHNGAALAATVAYKGATASYVNGVAVPDNPELTAVGLAGGWPINFNWRLQAALSYDLPVLGRNEPGAGIGFTTTVLRTF